MKDPNIQDWEMIQAHQISELNGFFYSMKRKDFIMICLEEIPCKSS